VETPRRYFAHRVTSQRRGVADLTGPLQSDHEVLHVLRIGQVARIDSQWIRGIRSPQANPAPAPRPHADYEGPGRVRRPKANRVLGRDLGPLYRIGIEVGCVEIRSRLPEACRLTSRRTRQFLMGLFPDTSECDVVVEIAPDTRQVLQYLDVRTF